MSGTPVLNAMTVDVEDYFHVSAFASVIAPAQWDQYESRVGRNTSRLLDLFEERGINSTFFVLGWVAARYPQLVRDIAARGHEIACHGWSHQLVFRQSPAEFRDETAKAKAVLEDIVQRPVFGYRAASYSITSKSLWALDTLAELGFRYDSSIFPVRHDRYGIPGARREPHRIKTAAGNELIEFPLSTATVGGLTLPVGGGGYFRLFPYALTRFGLRCINHGERRPFIFYLHPWEVDPAQPRIRASMLSRLRHYTHLDRCEHRLRKLTNEFSFGTVREVLNNLGFSVDSDHAGAAVARVG
jgi:polysaccharide deacetylase family protein (PEP-CTERM system associated)